ncbi:MAG: peptidase M14, partial [Planctomycetota bacterium]|nr:peptidase M14 [Planctomycetota bacterium]
DMWWNGGNRNVPVRHNIIGLLTEAASVNIASPIFLERRELRAPGDLPAYASSNRFPAPWPGGWWRLRDIIDYELAFGESLLGTLTRDRSAFIDNAIGAAERAMSATGAAGEPAAPRAWLLPADNEDHNALARLVDILDRGGVEVHSATADFTADGRDYGAGTLIVYRDQPYGQHVKDLFEVQRYPEGAAPYDVSGWTLPILFGLRRVEVVADFEAEAELVDGATDALARMDPDFLPEVMAGSDGNEWRALFGSLTAGGSATFRFGGDLAGHFTLGADLELSPEEAQDGVHNVVLEGLPRIGVYTTHSGSMNEGWLRWVLDGYGCGYTRLFNETIRAGALNELCDVIVLPSIGGSSLDRGRSPGSLPELYTRGLDPEGAIALEEFVRSGGRLVTMQSSATWATELFDLDLEEVTRGAGDFSCPGSVLRTVPGDGDLADGLKPSVPIFFSRGLAWELPDADGYEVPLRYAPRRVLYSGFLEGADVIQDKAAWVRAQYGEGSIDLFGFRPQYRSWSEAAFPLLFRALLLE